MKDMLKVFWVACFWLLLCNIGSSANVPGEVEGFKRFPDYIKTPFEHFPVTDLVPKTTKDVYVGDKKIT
jgi:hypothetical protein